MDVEDDIEFLRRSGRFGSEEEFLEEAVRVLLRTRPELRIDLAVEKYKAGTVSLNRAAEISGSSPGEFKELLAERGIRREPGFLTNDDRDERLDGL